MTPVVMLPEVRFHQPRSSTHLPMTKVGTPKTHKRRSVPFPALLAAALRKRCGGMGDEELVFATKNGTHERRWHNDHGWFPAAVRKAGIPSTTPHGLRHTAASLAGSADANVKAVQRILSDASAAMTLDVYADLFEDELDIVAGRLDDGLAQTVVGKKWAEAIRKEDEAR